MNSEILNKAFYENGLQGRTHEECRCFQGFIEDGLSLKPKVIITTSFRHPVEVDKMMDHSERLMRGLVKRLHSHLLPVFCYNCQQEWGWRNDYGEVKNDMHYNLLMDETISPLKAGMIVRDYFGHWVEHRKKNDRKKKEIRKWNKRAGLPPNYIEDDSDIHYWNKDATQDAEKDFPYGDTEIKLYQEGGFWNHYLTANHRQAFHVTFCHNRSGCKNKKGKERCIYRRSPQLIINNDYKPHPIDKRLLNSSGRCGKQ
jgi:hypothetical protein